MENKNYKGPVSFIIRYIYPNNRILEKQYFAPSLKRAKTFVQIETQRMEMLQQAYTEIRVIAFAHYDKNDPTPINERFGQLDVSDLFETLKTVERDEFDDDIHART
jgi:hypothetical protein